MEVSRGCVLHLDARLLSRPHGVSGRCNAQAEPEIASRMNETLGCTKSRVLVGRSCPFLPSGWLSLRRGNLFNVLAPLPGAKVAGGKGQVLPVVAPAGARNQSRGRWAGPARQARGVVARGGARAR